MSPPTRSGSPESGRSRPTVPYRALAMLAIAAAVFLVGIGIVKLTGSGSGSDTPAASTSTPTAAAETPAPAPGRGASTPPATASASRSTSTAAPTATIDVYNNSEVDGLAARTRERLSGSGLTVGQVGNYRETNVPTAVVYFAETPEARATAARVAEELGIAMRSSADGLPAGLSSRAPVIVIVTRQLDRR